MKRQQQLQQESNSYGLMWEENIRQELEAEINTEKAIGQIKKIAKQKDWEIEVRIRIEDTKLGIRLWRIS